MDIDEKVELMLKHVDAAIMVPTYLEDIMKKEIRKGFQEIKVVEQLLQSKDN